MVWQIDSASWAPNVRAAPSAHHVVKAKESSSLLIKGFVWGTFNGLPLQKRTYFSAYKFQRRTLLVVASLKSDDAVNPSSEFFELARRKVVKPFLTPGGDSSVGIPRGIASRVSFTRNYPIEVGDFSHGLFHSGRGSAHFQEATKRKLARGSEFLLPKLKKVCIDAWASGLRSLEATPIAPLLPHSSPLLAVLAVVLILGIVLGRWAGRASTRGVQLSNVSDSQVVTSSEPKAPTGISVLLDVDMKKKESVEWVNMVLGKLWKVYRLGLEGWVVSLLQPLIDNLHKPDYVRRVQIKRFDLGDEPISIRSVERRTSRRVNDLQYHIGLRYTGGARMILLLKLRAGFIPITIPVGVRGLDVDGELWVKLRLVPSEPWVGTATWAFVSLPKIKLDLSPFRLFNLMAIPFLSIFLTKLLTQDLPRLFVRPNKNVIDFLQGRAVGPVPKDFKGAAVEGNKGFSGELSVTLVDARKLKHAPFGKTDPYVILVLGDQVIRSKKNSQTSVFGPPGGPIWNQDFQLLVVDPKSQRLDMKVRDYIGLTAFTLGVGEVDLISLRDTVPVDKVVRLRGGWGPFWKRYAGEVLLRLTYTAYVDDEEEDIRKDKPLPSTNGPASDGTVDAVPLVKEVVDKVVELVQSVESVQGKDSTITEPVASFLSGEFYKEAPPGPEGVEETGNGRSTVAGADSRAEGASVGHSVPALAEDAGQNDGRMVLLWLGVVTLLSILVAISLNFSNLMNP